MALLAELKSSQEELEAQLLGRMTDFEAQLKAASPPAGSLTKLEADFFAFRDLVWGLLKNMRRQITNCMDSIDAMEMRHRRKALLFNGIPENAESDTAAVVDIIQTKLELPEINSSQIILCHRLGQKTDKRCRPTLVRFCNYNLKAAVWRKKTLLKGTSVSLTEFLTKSRQSTFVSARSHFGMRNCWSSDGVISIKLPDGVIRKINTMGELQELIKRVPKPAVADKPQVAAAASKPATKPTPVASTSSSVSRVGTRSQAAKK